MKKITIDWDMYASAERADQEFADKFRAEQLAIFLKEREQQTQTFPSLGSQSEDCGSDFFPHNTFSQ